jgi:uncharacterized MAPEG superfamily protein
MRAVMTSPSFLPFAISSIVLALNLLFLWGWSGAVRGKTKTAMNPEDSERFGATLVADHPPEVARVLRAHSNAVANIVPFLMLALLYVLIGGTARFAWIVFGIFVGARILHSIVYLNAKQPWRTLMFVVGGVATLVLLGDIIYMMATAA